MIGEVKDKCDGYPAVTTIMHGQGQVHNVTVTSGLTSRSLGLPSPVALLASAFA